MSACGFMPGRSSGLFGARSEVADSVIVGSAKPCAVPVVELKRPLDLELVLDVEQDTHSGLKAVAVAVDILSRARNMELETAVSLRLICIRVNSRERLRHPVRLCAERARSAAGGRAARAAGPLQCEVRRPLDCANLFIVFTYCMISSARSRSGRWIVIPRPLAVLTLTTNSYFVGACTGRSAGFSPFKMRST